MISSGERKKPVIKPVCGELIDNNNKSLLNLIVYYKDRSIIQTSRYAKLIDWQKLHEVTERQIF